MTRKTLPYSTAGYKQKGTNMADIDAMLQQLFISAEVARNIEAEKQRKLQIAEMQRKAMDRARTFAWVATALP